MKTVIFSIFCAISFCIFAQDQSTRREEKGPEGTIAYYVKVDAANVGTKVEVNGEFAGITPFMLKIFGDRDGTFHNFGRYEYVIQAVPSAGGEPEKKVFRTGAFFKPEDRIPAKVYFGVGPEHELPSRSGAGIEETSRKNSDLPLSFGTGFFVSSNGYVVTAYHVVAGARNIKVKIKNDLVSAELVKKDKGADIALLKVPGDFDLLSIGESKKVKLGQKVFTLGYPLPIWQGQQPKFTDGSVSALSGYQDDIASFQISVPVQGGNSGGPLVNDHGEVVGVIVAKLIGGENVNYAIKSSRLTAILEELSEFKTSQSADEKELSSEEIAEILSKATAMIVTY